VSQEAWLRRAGTAAGDGWDLTISPADAGWTFSGIDVATLEAGAGSRFSTASREVIIVPLEGGFTVHTDLGVQELEGRAHVFAGPTDVLYVPRGVDVQVHAPAGGRFAVASALADEDRPQQYVPRSDIPVEVRGRGQMTRRVQDFGNVGVVDAHRLIACEVVTPGGNWSSYPAHKHDTEGEIESELEEVYYFEVGDGPAGPGRAYVRVSASPGHEIDVLAEVSSGDVVLVPHGWHGPVMAAPGFDVYQLNVMAGPGAERRWGIVDDPATAWLRDTWVGLAPDPRAVEPGARGDD
jgi:5-deoxy-glucuronate isomerase